MNETNETANNGQVNPYDIQAKMQIGMFYQKNGELPSGVRVWKFAEGFIASEREATFTFEGEWTEASAAALKHFGDADRVCVCY
jgi:hypothetical protein